MAERVKLFQENLRQAGFLPKLASCGVIERFIQARKTAGESLAAGERLERLRQFFVR